MPSFMWKAAGAWMPPPSPPWRHVGRWSSMVRCWEPCVPSICRGSKTRPATCNSSFATGAGCFRASMEYSHGGVSLQEMVTPVLRAMATRPSGGSARILEAKWTGAKCRVSVGGHCVGVRVNVRTSQSDPDTSLLADKQARETTPEGKVTVFLENDSDIGKNAEIVLLDASGQAIHSLSTTLGE